MEINKHREDRWNRIYAEYRPVDLRDVTLSVEPLFDTCLMMFAKKTTHVLDFGCGTGDILFQYAQYKAKSKGVGIDLAEKGIAFAKETSKMSQYRNLHFFEGDESFLKNFETGQFDGIILSNVLDVMSENLSHDTVVELNRILKNGGYWFIKLNPFYSSNELREMDYEKIGHHMYGEKGELYLRQESTSYWMKFFNKIGAVERYVEFPYNWQPGMNRIFLVKKNKKIKMNF